MQMIDLMKRLAELDAKNPNIVKENQSGKIGTMGLDAYPDEIERMRATRAKMDGDAEWLLKNKPTDPCSKCGDSTTYRSSFGTSQSLICARCGKVRLSTDDRKEHQDMGESDDDLVGMVQSTIEDILSGAQQGQDMTDNIADELGDHFDGVQNSGDENLKQAYSMVRDAADTSPEEQAQAAQSALEMLSGGKDVEEGAWDKVKDFGQAMGYLGGELKRTLTTPSTSNAGQKFGKGQVTPGGPLGPIARYQNRNKNEGVTESLEECGMMGGMSSQPHSPASINMTAATGEELSGMLKDIMKLAGRPMQEPMDVPDEMGGEEPLGGADGVAVVDVEPSPEVGADSHGPSIMRSMLDKLNPDDDMGDELDDTDDEEKTDEMYDNSPDEKIAGYDAAVPSGNDLHKEKRQYPATQPGDNPMAATFEGLMFEYRKFVSEGPKEAHEQNMDAAQREMDSREAEGEDMSNHVIDPKTYKIVKKK